MGCFWQYVSLCLSLELLKLDHGPGSTNQSAQGLHTIRNNERAARHRGSPTLLSLDECRTNHSSATAGKTPESRKPESRCRMWRLAVECIAHVQKYNESDRAIFPRFQQDDQIVQAVRTAFYDRTRWELIYEWSESLVRCEVAASLQLAVCYMTGRWR